MLSLIPRFSPWPVPRLSDWYLLEPDGGSGDTIGTTFVEGQIESIVGNTAAYRRRSFRYGDGRTGNVKITYTANVGASSGSQVRIGLTSTAYAPGSSAIEFAGPHVGIFENPAVVRLNNVGSTIFDDIPYTPGTSVSIEVEYDFDANVTTVKVNGTQALLLEDAIPLQAYKLQHVGIRMYGDLQVNQLRVYTRGSGLSAGEYDPNLWLQYTFPDDEPINDVTERFITLAGVSAITTKELVTNPAAYTNYSATNPIVFDADEDFSVSLDLNMPFSDARSYNPILGVYNTSATPSAWAIGRYGNDAGGSPGLLHFIMISSGARYDFLSTNVLAANVDYNIEVSRKNNVLSMYIDGVLEGTWPFALGNAHQAYVPLRTDVFFGLNQSQSSHLGGGRKWNVRVSKGKAIHDAAFTPSDTLPAVGRLTYDQEASDAIRVQMDLRRDNAINEANRLGVQMFGTARIGQGAISQTAVTTSYYRTPMEPFGAGDFTVEVEFNAVTINATYGAVIAGQWLAGGQASADNCWCIYIGSTRVLNFSWANSAAANDFNTITTGGGAFLLNADNKVVIERIGTTLTIYINGVQAAQGECVGPLRTNAPHHVRSLSNQNAYAYAGKIWNLRIADKAMYNGVITHEPQFPKLRPRQQYEQSVLDDIVCQVSLRNGNPRNEKTGQNITVSGTGAVMLDGITTTLVNTSRFYIPLPHFGAADFTIELKLVMLSSSGASTRPIFGQFQGGAGPNSWIFYTLGTNIAFQALTVEGNSVTVDSATAGKTWVAGVEYHVVVERVGTTLSMYIDGVLMDSGTLVGDLVNMDAYPHITNLYDTSTAKFCASKIRDVRVAKRALFNGVINTSPLPEIPNQKPSLVMNSVTSPALHGAAQNLDYLSGISSIGAFSHTLFRDVRDPQNIKTVRVAALVNDRSYTVLGLRPSDIPPTADMPQLTNTMKVGTSTLLLSSGVGASTKAGVVGLYWGGNALGSNTPGKCIPFEFV